MDLQMFAEGDAGTTATTPDEPKVKLDDGTELTVEELKKGYMRQADYTRKTQETAALRKEAETITSDLAQFRPLVDLIQSDPNAAQAIANTLDALANGQTPTQRQVQQVTQAANASGDSAAVDAALDVEILRFEMRHQDDVKEYATENRDLMAELMDYMVEHEIPDFDVAFKAFNSDRGAKKAAEKALADAKAAAEAKAKAPNVGGTAPAGAPQPPPDQKISARQNWQRIGDAVQSALRGG